MILEWFKLTWFSSSKHHTLNYDWTRTQQADVSLIVDKTKTKNNKNEKNKKQKGLFKAVYYTPRSRFPTQTWRSMRSPSKNATLFWYIKRSVSNAVNYAGIQIYEVWLLFVAAARRTTARGRRGERTATTEIRRVTKIIARQQRSLILQIQPQIRSTFLKGFKWNNECSRIMSTQVQRAVVGPAKCLKGLERGCHKQLRPSSSPRCGFKSTGQTFKLSSQPQVTGPQNRKWRSRARRKGQASTRFPACNSTNSHLNPYLHPLWSGTYE